MTQKFHLVFKVQNKLNKNKFPISILVKLEKPRIKMKTLKSTRKKESEKKRSMLFLAKLEYALI